MSRYRNLIPDENITYQEVSNINKRIKDTTFVSPEEPRPQLIPSILKNGTREDTSYERGYHRAGFTYGPASKGYASLKYYGNGVY
ncbi:MAG TPA: hypothetical protein PKD85_07065 [Saprospiraceae bacterium]|nr:hypothetical protein [Saprospiraceae bacterium]